MRVFVCCDEVVEAVIATAVSRIDVCTFKEADREGACREEKCDDQCITGIVPPAGSVSL